MRDGKKTMSKTRIQRDDRTAREFARRLRDTLGTLVQNVYCFGSCAQGLATPDSDVDLLVETGQSIGHQDRNRATDIAVDVSAESGRVLEVHYYSTKELQTAVDGRSPFVKTVLEEGVIL